MTGVTAFQTVSPEHTQQQHTVHSGHQRSYREEKLLGAADAQRYKTAGLKWHIYATAKLFILYKNSK